ncbi:hypothetical protein E4U41_007168 [Claviceps citrina]|nr:hypothetical protein E4U41_007168 [Claviceps citrina]
MTTTAQLAVSPKGWTAVPLDAGQLFNGQPYKFKPEPLRTQEIKFPSDDAVVERVQAYAKEKLPNQTFNHSMRVYYYESGGYGKESQWLLTGSVASVILQQQFPDLAPTLSPSTLAITSLLHDIGTTDENTAATRMSFEFYGAFQALRVLKELGASQDQADAVCEAIVRHQDLGTVGSITLLGQVIQLATIFDNVSDHPHLRDMESMIHAETREDVIGAFPRTGWLACFAKTLQREVGTKPWSHTTHIPDFEDKVLGNKLMRRYES